MFVEAELTARIGDAGKRLHTARSRNDQVALDLRLYLRDECDGREGAAASSSSGCCCDKAGEHLDTVMPGYTHLQRAQPVTFAHHLLAWAQMLLRDLGRLRDAEARMNVCPLGCGRAGRDHLPDRPGAHRRAARASRPDDANSLDGVSDRDFCVELCVRHLADHDAPFTLFARRSCLWCSWEFKFIELNDAFATGSSIMPQKKEPRHRRAGARQDRAGLRRPDDPAHHVKGSCRSPTTRICRRTRRPSSTRWTL